MRLFYAVNFSSRTAVRIKEKQDRLRRFVKKGNWSPKANFHITLHYVGPIPEEELPLFTEALEEAASGIAPFSLDFSRYGSFRQRTGDLIYLAAEDPLDSLTLLSSRLRDILERGDMKPLRPHVTLVRNGRIDLGDLKRLKKEEVKFPAVRVTSVELMESLTIDRKLTYRSLHSVRLSGENP